MQANQAWAAKDLEKVMAFYADDAVLMTPGMDAVHGKDAIRASLERHAGDPAVSLTFQSSKVDVAKSGDLGYTAGTYKLTVTNPATHKPINDSRQLRNHVPQTGRRLVESGCGYCHVLRFHPGASPEEEVAESLHPKRRSAQPAALASI